MHWTEWVTLISTLALAGWVSAFLTQWIKQARWPSWVKLILSMVMAAIVGLATAWQGGALTEFIDKWGSMTAGDVTGIIVLVFTAAQVWYFKFFKEATWATTLGLWPKKE
jgi:hypothetical protein